MDLYTTIRKIKSVKIQGAENIAEAAVKALRCVSDKSKAANKKQLLKQLNSAAKELECARPTEPCTNKALKFVLSGAEKQKTPEGVKKLIAKNAELALKHFTYSDKKIAELGARLIKNNSVVFTHCHSSTVIAILKKAKRQKKKFKVYNTATRPLLQGRKTSKELAKAGIPVTYFLDSAAQLAIKEADIMLIGADAITKKGDVINKIGSGMFAEIASTHKVPVYVCTDSWKFSPRQVKIETRSRAEIWNPLKKIKINTAAFATVKPELIMSIISEKGMLSPKEFVRRAT